MTEDEMLEAINSYDGIEVPRELWEIAEALVAKGLIASLGPARGPDKSWRRAYPIDNIDLDDYSVRV